MIPVEVGPAGALKDHWEKGEPRNRLACDCRRMEDAGRSSQRVDDRMMAIAGPAKHAGPESLRRPRARGVP
jgi:hypothetical protein